MSEGRSQRSNDDNRDDVAFGRSPRDNDPRSNIDRHHDDFFGPPENNDEYDIEDDRNPSRQRSQSEFGKFELSIGTPQVSGKEGREQELPKRTNISSDDIVSRKKFNRLEAHLDHLDEEIKRFEDRFLSMEEDNLEMKEHVDSIKMQLDNIDLITRDIEEMREGYIHVEKSLRELSALYDLISSKNNPFVDISPDDQDNDIDMSGKISHDTNSNDIEQDDVEYEDYSSKINPFVDMEDGSGHERNEMADNMDQADGFGRYRKEQNTTSVTHENRSDARNGAKAKMTPEVHHGTERTISQNWLLRWTKFLLTRARVSGIKDLLEYYRSIDWIDEKVEEGVLNILEGSRDTDELLQQEEPDKVVTEMGEVVFDGSDWKLSLKDHETSLEYINKIYGRAGSDPGT